jgi:hypothetical protein
VETRASGLPVTRPTRAHGTGENEGTLLRGLARKAGTASRLELEL